MYLLTVVSTRNSGIYGAPGLTDGDIWAATGNVYEEITVVVVVVVVVIVLVMADQSCFAVPGNVFCCAFNDSMTFAQEEL